MNAINFQENRGMKGFTKQSEPKHFSKKFQSSKFANFSHAGFCQIQCVKRKSLGYFWCVGRSEKSEISKNGKLLFENFEKLPLCEAKAWKIIGCVD